MLEKYWSVFLLAGLAITALIDKRRAIYFRSFVPWITIAVGLAVIAPQCSGYTATISRRSSTPCMVHGAKPFSDTLVCRAGLSRRLARLCRNPGASSCSIAARPNRKTMADMIWPNDGERRLAAAAFWGPLLLPALGASPSGTELTSLWSMSAWTLLPVLLLSPPAVTIKEIDTSRVLVAAVPLPLVMLIASPVDSHQGAT